MHHGYPIIPDILTVLFILACVVKLTRHEKPEVEIVTSVKKPSIYPIPRGRMS